MLRKFNQHLIEAAMRRQKQQLWDRRKKLVKRIDKDTVEVEAIDEVLSRMGVKRRDRDWK